MKKAIFILALLTSIGSLLGAIEQEGFSGVWEFNNVGTVINNTEPLMPNYSYFVSDESDITEIVDFGYRIHKISFLEDGIAKISRENDDQETFIYQIENKVYSIPFDTIVRLQSPSGEKIELFLDTSKEELYFMYEGEVLSRAPFLGSAYMQGVLVRD